MKKKQVTRERIFRNNRVELSNNDRISFAIDEVERQTKTTVYMFIRESIEIDVSDPFVSVSCAENKNSDKLILGYSKRMPNDIPNDKIAIQVAVSRLIKRLKNDS